MPTFVAVTRRESVTKAGAAVCGQKVCGLLLLKRLDMEFFFPITTVLIKSGFSPTRRTKVEAGQTWSGRMSRNGIFTFWLPDSAGRLKKVKIPKSDTRIEILY